MGIDRVPSSNTDERMLAEAHRRRLTRLGFDIHDGPLQDLALLGEDVRLLRRQLTEVLPADLAPVVLGRLEDLDARLLALDDDLRRISTSLQSPLTEGQTISEALEYLTQAFASRAGVQPRLSVDGDLDVLTDSQQLALLSIVREALNNVREHSEASEVGLTVEGLPTSFELRVLDNGIGFDIEETLMRAGRDGRFGLIGMQERVRLLGGSSRIDSRPGGPTTITVTIPRWRPLAQAGDETPR